MILFHTIELESKLSEILNPSMNLGCFFVQIQSFAKISCSTSDFFDIINSSLGGNKKNSGASPAVILPDSSFRKTRSH